MPKIAVREKEKTVKTVEKKAAKQAVAVADTEAVAAPACAHHWVIASPDGEMSVGKCKVCGAEKEFPNSAEDYLWGAQRPAVALDRPRRHQELQRRLLSRVQPAFRKAKGRRDAAFLLYPCGIGEWSS